MPDTLEVFMLGFGLYGEVETQEVRTQEDMARTAPRWASPKARGEARRLQLTPSQIAQIDPTGVGGGITVEDVREFVEEYRKSTDDPGAGGEQAGEYEERGAANTESRLIQWLNKKADDIASDVEREVRRVLRPFAFGSVTVQAEVSFRPGTLVIEGTVIAAVAGALGTVAGRAVSQALGQNLGKLLEIPISRLMRRRVNEGNEEAVQGQLQFESFRVEVTPDPVTRTLRQPTVPPSSENAPSTNWLTWTAVTLSVLNTMLLVALLVLLIIMAP
jgi:hypothetical protein